MYVCMYVCILKGENIYSFQRKKKEIKYFCLRYSMCKEMSTKENYMEKKGLEHQIFSRRELKDESLIFNLFIYVFIFA